METRPEVGEFKGTKDQTRAENHCNRFRLVAMLQSEKARHLRMVTDVRDGG